MNYSTLTLLVSCLMGIGAVHVEDCGSKLGSFSKVSITNCDGDSDNCILKKGTEVTISIQFTTNVEVKKVKAQVHGILQGIPIPFPIPNPDGCANSGLVCPLSKNTPQNFSAVFPIKSTYPKVHVVVKWELLNEANEEIICITLPAQIK